jgi:phosphinothricin acetyltransferase
MTIIIRPAAPKDAAALTQIYNHYILNTTATFEETPITAKDMAARIERIAAHNLPWFIAEDSAQTITGYAYAAPWKPRSAYRQSAEVTVYTAPNSGGSGLGTALYSALFSDLKTRDIHMVMGGITLPNPASIALHEKFGLTHMGSFKEVGLKFGNRIDVGYWQARIEDLEA